VVAVVASGDADVWIVVAAGVPFSRGAGEPLVFVTAAAPGFREGEGSGVGEASVCWGSA
jgi:hypothetical protein